ncbi:DUF1129 family protein [Oceanobacillus salinisoli]|uniref:DUF1129 family protein n=1 Tax=Oceanobacillus salinisoli TaxID=2678611 RepID=UPI0012E17063|nr:DUF1129 family protein [Oceanobacillus salinisoli]
MNAKDIIKMNNEKREQLSEKNKAYYEDMLTYIRLNTTKSEQQTEEVLLELLDHLLEADAQGKTAKDVFGEDLQAYCNELLTEIPGEKVLKNIYFISFLILDLLAILALFQGIVGYGLYTLFDIGTNSLSFPLGSGLLIGIIDLLLIAFWVVIILKWLKGSTFQKKKQNKWIEFLQLWLICSVFIGLSLVAFMFMPDFGITVNIHHLMIAGSGLILYLIKMFINKRFRVTT